MAQTRQELLKKVSQGIDAEIESTIRRKEEPDYESGKSPAEMTLKHASEEPSVKDIILPPIVQKKKKDRKFDIGNAFNQAMESSYDSYEDDDTEEADNAEVENLNKRVEYYELLQN